MVYSSRWALCAAVTGATALQIPLFSSNNQALLMPAGGHGETKPLVNSTELQDLISGDRLMTRAKKLYDIAKLGEEEYNHPTRVIGSAGLSTHVLTSIRNLNYPQGTLALYPTSTRPFYSLETTTPSQTRASLLFLVASLNHDLFLATMSLSLQHLWV